MSSVGTTLHHYSIEDHLKAWCEEHREYDILWSSYVIDKASYANRMQAVEVNSGHYSLHDSTHSESIITYVELLLGENQIRKLTASDAWLILEVAYAHDIGMYISEEEIKREWNTSAFGDYLVSSLHSGSLDLQEAASAFLNADYSRKTAEEALRYLASYGYEGIDAHLRLAWSIKILATDYRRRRHASESAALLSRDFNDHGTKHGVPLRLYKTVSYCADAHGFSREKVFSEAVLEETKGLYKDLMHPRFVAMLIRIGDLLDIDNNRFNPYVIAAFGELPESSVPHKYKHLCVNHILVTPETIEVRSDLTPLTRDDILPRDNHRIPIIAGTYKETYYWFSMIEEELRFWHEREYEFIPEGFFPKIPKLQRRDIDICGKTYKESDILREFSVDYNRVLGIIGSRNFYRDRMEFIRELTQNAFDAVKRHLQKRSAAIMKSRFDDLGQADLQAYLDVNLELITSSKTALAVIISICEMEIDGELSVGIAISDCGTGIPRSSYPKLQRIGTEQPAGKQPALLETAGEFGIGVHSVFSVVDILNYRTFSEEEPLRNQLEIEARERGGRIVVLPDEIKPVPDRETHGTDAWFFVKERTLAEVLFDEVPAKGIGYIQIINRLKAKVKELLAPNVTDLYFFDKGRVNNPEKLIESNPHLKCVMAIPSMFSEDLFQYGNSRIWKKGSSNQFGILLCNQDAKSFPIVLSINLDNASEKTRIAYKGCWITGTKSVDAFRLHGLNIQLHILDRTASKTVTTQREDLLPEAVNELQNEQQRAFHELLIYLAQPQENGPAPLDAVMNANVLQSLVKHYRVFLASTEDNANKVVFQEAINKIRSNIGDNEIEGYQYTAPIVEQQLEATLSRKELKRAEVDCEDPCSRYWLRGNKLFQPPTGLYPKVPKSGLHTDCDLCMDIWENLSPPVYVSEFYLLQTYTYSSEQSLIVRYSDGQTALSALSNTESFEMLLDSWLRQIQDLDPIQFIPAIRLEADSGNLLAPLAVKECDAISEQQWKLFPAYIKMPITLYANQYELVNGAKTQATDYSDIMEKCPCYMESLIQYTFENQLDPGKYSVEQIRQAYQYLVGLLISSTCSEASEDNTVVF